MTLYHTLLVLGSLALLFAGGIVLGLFIGIKKGQKDCENWEQEAENWKQVYDAKASENYRLATQGLRDRIRDLEQELLQRDLQHPL